MVLSLSFIYISQRNTYSLPENIYWYADKNNIANNKEQIKLRLQLNQI